MGTKTHVGLDHRFHSFQYGKKGNLPSHIESCFLMQHREKPSLSDQSVFFDIAGVFPFLPHWFEPFMGIGLMAHSHPHC